MPYANRTAFARQMRAYLNDKSRRLPAKTVTMYRQWLEDTGERLGWPNPADITLRQLESLEAEYMAIYAQCTVTEKMSILRDMLRTIGNKDALRYKMLCSMQPAKDRGRRAHRLRLHRGDAPRPPSYRLRGPLPPAASRPKRQSKLRRRGSGRLRIPHPAVPEAVIMQGTNSNLNLSRIQISGYLFFTSPIQILNSNLNRGGASHP